jgi:hypothetical protein
VADNMSIYNVFYIRNFVPNNWYKEGKKFITTPNFDSVEANSKDNAIQKIQKRIQKNNFKDVKGTTRNIVTNAELIE